MACPYRRAPEITRGQFELSAKALHHRSPNQPEFWPTMEEQKRSPLAETSDIEMQVTNLNTVLLDTHGFCRRESLPTLTSFPPKHLRR